MKVKVLFLIFLVVLWGSCQRPRVNEGAKFSEPIIVIDLVEDTIASVAKPEPPLEIAVLVSFEESLRRYTGRFVAVRYVFIDGYGIEDPIIEIGTQEIIVQFSEDTRGFSKHVHPAELIIAIDEEGYLVRLGGNISRLPGRRFSLRNFPAGFIEERYLLSVWRRSVPSGYFSMYLFFRDEDSIFLRHNVRLTFRTEDGVIAGREGISYIIEYRRVHLASEFN